MTHAPAVLVLEDGTRYTGRAYGARGRALGEAVFATGMSGYQETLTDPSYAGQIVVQTAPHIGNTGMTFVLNGEKLQEGTTAQMIHTVAEQVVYASNIVTLRPGDVIATGTPPGVGSARNPPILLKAGDRMSCSYDGVGTLTNPVVGS